MDKNVKAFMVYVALITSKISIYLARKAQIALLIAKEVTVPAEYSDFADVFSKKSAEVLLKCTESTNMPSSWKMESSQPMGQYTA